MLVNNKKIVGIIDFESSQGRSADIDFTKMSRYVWNNYEGTREAFIEGYETIRPLPDIDKILPFYYFFNAYGGVAWCVKRGKYDDPFMEENMSQLLESIM